jgi:hypothetical protein
VRNIPIEKQTKKEINEIIGGTARRGGRQRKRSGNVQKKKEALQKRIPVPTRELCNFCRFSNHGVPKFVPKGQSG